MIGDSFQFGKYNSREDWGIRVIATDVLLPPKKENKIDIPGKHGRYSSKNTVYDERIVRVLCVLEKQITKADLREIAYGLSSRRRLYLWNEPDKYYNAEIYDSSEITDFPKEVMREFTLTFICDPFAYGKFKKEQLETGKNKINYDGTINSETKITLVNNGSTDISNIQIIATQRRN